MARICAVALGSIFMAFVVSCSGRSAPPPPATDTPFPTTLFPYQPGSKVVMEGRNDSGRLVHSQFDVWKDLVGERVVACTIAHGAVADVWGFQYQQEEKRWYVGVKYQDCSGYVRESSVRRPATDSAAGDFRP